MSAPAVPMTAGEAASKFYADRAEWMNMSTGPFSFQEWLTDWFSDHWPQPVSGQLTGRDVLGVLNAHGIYVTHRGDSDLTSAAYAALDRAAARLAAPQGVGLDVEAVAKEIVQSLVHGFPAITEVQQIAAILRRHTPSVAAGREVVDELQRQRAQGGPTSYDTDEASLAYTDALGEMIEWMDDTTAAASGTGEG